MTSRLSKRFLASPHTMEKNQAKNAKYMLKKSIKSKIDHIISLRNEIEQSGNVEIINYFNSELSKLCGGAGIPSESEDNPSEPEDTWDGLPDF